MMKRAIRKILVFAFTLCLMAGMITVGTAESVGDSDFQAMRPVMDLVASAAICASDFPAVISDAESTLDNNFITFFFTNGLKADPSLNITQAMLTDTSLQEQYLKSIFSAKLPALDAITPPETAGDYIGFLPVRKEEADSGDIYLIGELYRGTMSIEKMGNEDYKSLSWVEPAIFTLRTDAAAPGGYRIDGFSVGSELLMDVQLQDYTNAILMEYNNSKLGFSLYYPSLFTEDYVTEDASGASAVLPDGSASFSVKRMDNANNANLNEYVLEIATASGEEARVNVNEQFQYATVAYDTADGNSVFSICFVTDKYVYMAELTYPTDQSITYSMYTMYLENSFGVDEVSVG